MSYVEQDWQDFVKYSGLQIKMRRIQNSVVQFKFSVTALDCLTPVSEAMSQSALPHAKLDVGHMVCVDDMHVIKQAGKHVSYMATCRTRHCTHQGTFKHTWLYSHWYM